MTAHVRSREHRPAHSHHYAHPHDHVRTFDNKKGLAIALIITSGVMLLEFIGGIVTNSLALLSDAGHMLHDAASLALSLNGCFPRLKWRALR